VRSRTESAGTENWCVSEADFREGRASLPHLNDSAADRTATIRRATACGSPVETSIAAESKKVGTGAMREIRVVENDYRPLDRAATQIPTFAGFPSQLGGDTAGSRTATATEQDSPPNRTAQSEEHQGETLAALSTSFR